LSTTKFLKRAISSNRHQKPKSIAKNVSFPSLAKIRTQNVTTDKAGKIFVHSVVGELKSF